MEYDLAQGFYFWKPALAETTAELLAEQHVARSRQVPDCLRTYLYVLNSYMYKVSLLAGEILLASSLRKIFVAAFVLGSLVVVCLGLYGILGQDGPIEDAGRLAKAGSSGVGDVPKMPEVGREKEVSFRTMNASYYGYSLAGNPTASGDPFDPEEHTAAHKSLPLGTELLVKRGDEAVRVTVNDRGPYVAGRDLDLSIGAAREVGLIGPGEDQVSVALL